MNHSKWYCVYQRCTVLTASLWKGMAACFQHILCVIRLVALGEFLGCRWWVSSLRKLVYLFLSYTYVFLNLLKCKFQSEFNAHSFALTFLKLKSFNNVLTWMLLLQSTHWNGQWQQKKPQKNQPGVQHHINGLLWQNWQNPEVTQFVIRALFKYVKPKNDRWKEGDATEILCSYSAQMPRL